MCLPPKPMTVTMAIITASIEYKKKKAALCLRSCTPFTHRISVNALTIGGKSEKIVSII